MHVSMLSPSDLPASLYTGSKENFRESGFHTEPFNIVLCTRIDFIKTFTSTFTSIPDQVW